MIEQTIARYRDVLQEITTLDKALRPLNITFIQWCALKGVVEDRINRPKDIAIMLGHSSQTITGLLDRLERGGLIERYHVTTYGADRRAVVLTATKLGTHVYQDGKEVIDGVRPNA